MSDPPQKTLVPGYTHVDAFGPASDYDEHSEEVSYLTLDLGAVEPTLVPSSSSFRLIVSPTTPRLLPGLQCTRADRTSAERPAGP